MEDALCKSCITQIPTHETRASAESYRPRQANMVYIWQIIKLRHMPASKDRDHEMRII